MIKTDLNALFCFILITYSTKDEINFKTIGQESK